MEDAQFLLGCNDGCCLDDRHQSERDLTSSLRLSDPARRIAVSTTSRLAKSLYAVAQPAGSGSVILVRTDEYSAVVWSQVQERC
jgi:hypothetical protein